MYNTFLLLLKSRYFRFIFAFTLFTGSVLLSQNLRRILPQDHAILINAVANNGDQPSITLQWVKNELSLKYEIRRKKFDEPSFSYYPIAVMSKNDSQYVDMNVEKGVTYEYEIRDSALGKITLTFRRQDGSTFDSSVTCRFRGFGYISSGIESNDGMNYGYALLLVDKTIAEPLKNEIDRFMDDLTAEGWTVARRDVPRTEAFNGAAVKSVKEIINEEYNKSEFRLTTIILLGRIAVPYSGNLNPDAHPDHLGAWPADVYYGYLDETFWTDNAINNSSASRQENKNIPGDGKFDQSAFPYSDVNLDIGRIDFYNMPLFDTDANEIELYRRYLNKNHDYRVGNMQYLMRGLMDDNFTGYMEGFGSSGWRNLAALCGKDKVKSADWFTTLANDSYLWAYGCGGGSYTSCGGIGDTKAKDSAGIYGFVGNQVKSVFTMLFGSYFGDWDSKNNFLRAGLCTEPSILTCAWSGRPHWFFHHMGMGFPIGYSARISQNNGGIYVPNVYFLKEWYPNYPEEIIYAVGFKGVHIELMGDPTLRMFSASVPQPKNVSAVQPKGERVVEIKWSAPDLYNKYIYNIYRSTTKYGPWEKVNAIPISGQTSLKYYDSTLLEGNVYYMVRTFNIQESNTGTFINGSRGVIVSTIVTSVNDSKLDFDLKCSPNPVFEDATISLTLDKSTFININIYDLNGSIVKSLESGNLADGLHTFNWDLTDDSNRRLPAGVYLLRANLDDKTKVVKITILK